MIFFFLQCYMVQVLAKTKFLDLEINYFRKINMQHWNKWTVVSIGVSHLKHRLALTNEEEKDKNPLVVRSSKNTTPEAFQLKQIKSNAPRKYMQAAEINNSFNK